MSVRKSAPTGKPYNFNDKNKYQCTWYAYWRAYEMFGVVPCYWDRATKKGSYTDAKFWLDNYHEGWTPIWVKDNPNYRPVVGDIVVFNGNAGHVMVIEEDLGGDIRNVSQYNMKSPNKFSFDKWTVGSIMTGTPYNTGEVLGYLHFGELLQQVAKDTSKDQIYVKGDVQYIRNAPTTIDSKILGYVTKGYYNVVGLEKKADYIWAILSAGDYLVYVAIVNGRVDYLPKLEEIDYKSLYEQNEAKLKLVKEYVAKIEEALK